MYKMLEQRHPSETSLKVPQERVDFWHDGRSPQEIYSEGMGYNLDLITTANKQKTTKKPPKQTKPMPNKTTPG